jgi:hypothetical protein
MGLASGVDLGAEVGSGGARLGEVAREDWLHERSENDLGTTARLLEKALNNIGGLDLPGLGQSHPKDKDELESVVEGWIH